jgi:outer membrane receptor protein involved in Fe transport
MKHQILLLLSCFLSISAMAQYTVSGQITDNLTGEPMIGVTINSTGGKNAVTDYDGNFQLSSEIDIFQLTFSYIGYKTEKIEMSFREETGDSLYLSVRLLEATSILDAVVVSSGRYEKDLLKETVSIDLITPELLNNNQVTQLDQIIAKVPGVQIIDEQASIRGSGFSFGAGSRVMVVLDGLPLLAPEGSNIPWNYIPIENIAQIEVLKGASSVLYGTSAMNGLINVRTAYPTSKTKTTWQTYVGVYDNPQKEYQIWWKDKPQPHQIGTYVSHRTKVNKNFDLVLGGHAHKELSYLQGADERRYRFNFNTRYRITDNLAIGINGNFMEFSKGFWSFWADNDTLGLKPLSPISLDSYYSRNFDPYVNYTDPFDNQHSIKTRLYSVTYLRTGNSPNTTANVNHYEYQFNRKFKNNFSITAGISRQTLSVASPVFGLDTFNFVSPFTAVDTFTTSDKKFTGNVTSYYAQFDKSFIDDRLSIVFGSRWETYAFADETQAGFPVFRLGSSFEINPKNILRASFGQGYRLPSLAEQFVDYNNGFQNFPNPELRPEIGASYEIGYKRVFNKKEIKGYFDVAIFYQDYDDLIEPVFGFYNKDTLRNLFNFDFYGFQYQNITEAKILGFELGTSIDGNIGDLGYRLWSGYTYTFPVDLSRDTANLDNVGNFISAATSSIFGLDSIYQESILLYRNLHNVRLDLELYYQDFTVGFSANYQSKMVNVDDVIVGEGFFAQSIEIINGGAIFPGMRAFRASQPAGDWVFDLRFNYAVTENFRLNFIINNVMNREYALRIGRINPPRQFTLKLQVGI